MNASPTQLVGTLLSHITGAVNILIIFKVTSSEAVLLPILPKTIADMCAVGFTPERTFLVHTKRYAAGASRGLPVYTPPFAPLLVC